MALANATSERTAITSPQGLEPGAVDALSIATPPASGHATTVSVWDWPLRLFHWLLLGAVATAIATGLAGGDWMTWHGRAGLAIVALLGFRLVWGLVGSTTSRFGHFFPTPARLRVYFSGAWQGVGHNPLGAFSVFALLGLLTLQVATGLFSNDDIAFAGPLAQLVGEEAVGDLTAWHHRLINVLYGLIGLHLAAIAFYALVKRQRLVRHMVTGKKAVEPGAHVPSGTSRARPGALVVAVVVAGLLTWVASGAWISPPPAPATSTTTATPAW